MKGNKAQNSMLIAGVIGIIVVSTLLLVGNRVYNQISSSMPSSNTAADAVNANISANTNAAFSLSAVAPLLLSSSLILLVILGFASAVRGI